MSISTARGLPRQGRRIALVLSTVGMSLLLPAATASAADLGFSMYDADGDGYVDASAVDISGPQGVGVPDGILDANRIHVQGATGYLVLLDLNQDGEAEFVGQDSDRDGVPEQWFIDLDEDNVFESMSLTGPPNSTAGIDFEGNVCPQDPFYCPSMWPRVSNNGPVTSSPYVGGPSIGAGLTDLSNAEGAFL